MKKWIGVFACLAVGCAVAQPVYRCGNTYSHEPCPGAKLVDTTYTEGVDSLSGKQRIHHNESTKRAFRDLSYTIRGESKKGPGFQERYDARLRRSKNNLSYSQMRECEKLDEAMPLEKDPNRLYELRLQYRRGGC